MEWAGAAALCIKNGRVLMVKQGTPEEKKTWTVPSGGRETGETLEQCCIRETLEETGYKVTVIDKIHEKYIEGYVHVTYFLVDVNDGSPRFQDPDDLIYDIAWKSAKEIKGLDLAFPEDRDFLMEQLK